MSKIVNRLFCGIGGWLVVVSSGIPFGMICYLMAIHKEELSSPVFRGLCLTALAVFGFVIACGIRSIIASWREYEKLHDILSSLSPEEKVEFDKAIADGDVRVVRGDDGKIHVETLDFG